MRIGNRQLPYAVFNRESSLNCFQTGTFNLAHTEREEDASNGYYIVYDACYQTNSPFLKRLIAEGKAEAVLVVECSAMLYRQTFKLTETPQDIKIKSENLAERVEVSAFVYAKEPIDAYSDPDFMDLYQGVNTSLEKNDIIAIDDGYTLSYSRSSYDSDYIESIVSVIKTGNDDSIISFGGSLDERKITIYMPPKQYQIYIQTKDNRDMQSIYFGTLLVPAIADALDRLYLELVQNPDKTLSDLEEEYRWLPSLEEAYKKATKREFSLDAGEHFVMAQEIMKYASAMAIQATFALASNSFSGSSSEED